MNKLEAARDLLSRLTDGKKKSLEEIIHVYLSTTPAFMRPYISRMLMSFLKCASDTKSDERLVAYVLLNHTNFSLECSVRSWLEVVASDESTDSLERAFIVDLLRSNTSPDTTKEFLKLSPAEYINKFGSPSQSSPPLRHRGMNDLSDKLSVFGPIDTQYGKNIYLGPSDCYSKNAAAGSDRFQPTAELLIRQHEASDNKFGPPSESSPVLGDYDLDNPFGTAITHVDRFDCCSCSKNAAAGSDQVQAIVQLLLCRHEELMNAFRSYMVAFEKLAKSDLRLDLSPPEVVVPEEHLRSWPNLT